MPTEPAQTYDHTGPSFSTPGETEIRLLDAAGEVFADRGFREATVREICAKAGANIAAVNYHFGDKERLYHAVIAHAGTLAIAKYPPSGKVPSHAPVEERLHAYIAMFLERLLDESGGRPAWHGRLMAREMIEPTGALDEIVKRFIEPQHLRLREMLQELATRAGHPLCAQSLRWCACSVVGQCLFYKHCRPVVERLMPEQDFGPGERSAIAAHITRFCIAGVMAAAQSPSVPRSRARAKEGPSS